jgi:hypothetical protein
MRALLRTTSPIAPDHLKNNPENGLPAEQFHSLPTIQEVNKSFSIK